MTALHVHHTRVWHASDLTVVYNNIKTHGMNDAHKHESVAQSRRFVQTVDDDPSEPAN